MKCWAGWIISWNQDFWEKYQQPRTCRYQFNGRKRRGTKESLNEGGRGKWKSWLKVNIQKTKIMESSNKLHGKQKGKKWKQWQTLFSWAPKSLQTVTAIMKLKDACSLEEKLWQTWHIKKQADHFANRGPYSQSYVFSSSHVWMWWLDHKESWTLKNWCFWIVVLKKTLKSSLDCKEMEPVNPKWNQPRIFIGRMMLKLQYFDT